MAVASPERVRDDLTRLVHRGAGLQELTAGAKRVLGRAVGFEGICVLTMDPATFLPTGEAVENGLPREVFERMREIEVSGRDINSFESLARAPRPAASLSAATGGELARSERHREVRQAHGMGDELRAVLGRWGALTLSRGADTRPFTEADVAFVASVAAELEEGVRRVTLYAVAEAAADEGGAGLLLLAEDNAIASADPIAERWLVQLDDGPLPAVVGAVATRARAIAGGQALRPASARVRTPAGHWLLVRGSALDRHVAVIIEAAGVRELAPLAVDAYRLTERERAVTRLVAEGLPTDAIAGRLHISPWTVQDHLKAVFEKVGVGTRGELVARLFITPRIA